MRRWCFAQAIVWKCAGGRPSHGIAGILPGDCCGFTNTGLPLFLIHLSDNSGGGEDSGPFRDGGERAKVRGIGRKICHQTFHCGVCGIGC